MSKVGKRLISAAEEALAMVKCSGDPRLIGVSDLDLLRELLRRSGTQPGPRQINWSVPTRSAVIGIGPDHIAEVILGVDAMAELEAHKWR